MKKTLTMKGNFLDDLNLMIKVAQALVDLHGKNIAHLDVKPENICQDEKEEVSFIDFGFSVEEQSPKNPQRGSLAYQGTLEYFSPEISSRKSQKNLFLAQKASDAWAVGIMLFETLQRVGVDVKGEQR